MRDLQKMLAMEITTPMEHKIMGVPGSMTQRSARLDSQQHWHRQRWVSEWRPLNGDKHDYKAATHAAVRIQFCDYLTHGVSSFDIAVMLDPLPESGMRQFGIALIDVPRLFPELKPLLKWRHMTSVGPPRYIDDTLYHAGDLDYNGRSRGEPSSWDDEIKFSGHPITYDLGTIFINWLQEALPRCHSAGNEYALKLFNILEVPRLDKDGRKPPSKWTYEGYNVGWHLCPFNSYLKAEQFRDAFYENDWRVTFVKIPTSFSEGKERNLEAARSAAVWPEATDEQLKMPRAFLKLALQNRLSALIDDFRQTIKNIGFYWSPEEMFKARNHEPK